MKKIVALLLAVMMLMSLAACGGQEKPQGGDENKPAVKPAVNVTGIAGPTGVGLVHLMDADAKGESKCDYTFNLVSDPTEAVAAITKGTADIAAVPTNLASTLYKKTNGNVQVLAVNTLGVLYMMSNGVEVNSVADLAGKTIYSSGQGANPEYILKYVLEKNNVQDVTIKFVDDNDALCFYRSIAQNGLKMLRAGGGLYFEIYEQFGSEVAEMLAYLGYRDIEVVKDIFGKDRMVWSRR
jgi:NitT/TauT family transport system substrate-binding protein